MNRWIQGAAVAAVLTATAACSSKPTRTAHDAEAAEREAAARAAAAAAMPEPAHYTRPEAPSVVQPDSRLVFFDFDSDRIRPEFAELLRQHAQYLAAHPGERVTLEGHADERGTQDYNLALGERRARAVEQFLLMHGATPEQLRIVSYGELRPLVRGRDEESYAKNRRVEIVYRKAG